jgi:putative polymerase
MRTEPRPLITLGLVAATLFFNVALCFVNTNVTAVREVHVILAEAVIMASTWGVLLLSGRTLQTRWICFALACVVFAILVMILRQEVLLKSVRDLIIIPTFVLLGIQFGRRDLSKLLIALCVVVLAMAIAEVAFLDTYQKYFNIIRYFISKGATPEEQATFTSTSLFVSGMRSGGRMLGLGDFLGQQRASSIFLEPVSSAMFAAIVFFYTLSVFNEIDKLRAAALLTLATIFLVLSDGRLAMGLTAAAIVAYALLYRLPKLSLYLYLLAAVAFAFVVESIRQVQSTSDDVLGRLSKTAQILGSMDMSVMLGLSRFPRSAVDSGIAYMIEGIGLLGTAVFWCGLCTIMRYDDRAQRRFAHMICLYLSLSWLVSYATFTIKTAALLWFLFGTLQVSSSRQRSRLGSRATTAAVLPVVDPLPVHSSESHAQAHYNMLMAPEASA